MAERDDLWAKSHPQLQNVEAEQREEIIRVCLDEFGCNLAIEVEVPRFRCLAFNETFDSPTLIPKEVTTYRTRHESAWCHLYGLMTNREVRSFALSEGPQQSMRPMDGSNFRRRIDLIDPQALWPIDVQEDELGEYARARMLRGTNEDLNRLSISQDLRCMITGPAPLPQALEPVVLKSYSRGRPERSHGVALIRRDLRLLFDTRLLSMDLRTPRLVASSRLRLYPQYARLSLTVSKSCLRYQQRAWFQLQYTTID